MMMFFSFFSLKISHSLGFIFSWFQAVSCKKKGNEILQSLMQITASMIGLS